MTGMVETQDPRCKFSMVFCVKQGSLSNVQMPKHYHLMCCFLVRAYILFTLVRVRVTGLIPDWHCALQLNMLSYVNKVCVQKLL